MSNQNNVNLSLQVIPINTTEAYAAIDEAIYVIQRSGLKYEVQPFATVLEGPLEELLEVVMQAKDAALAAGGDELVLNLQIHLKKGEHVKMESKTAKFQKE